MTRIMALAAGMAAVSGVAHAGVDQLKLGLSAHNAPVLADRNADNERGVNVVAQVLFDSPAALRWAGRPRPFVYGSVNTDLDNTSFGGVGLAWRVRLSQAWALEPTVGYMIHNGEIDNRFPRGSPAAVEFSDDNVLLGSRDLFQTSLALSRRITPHWSGEVYIEHLSHGQILGSGRNQGLDNVGVRFGYSFGG